MSPTRCRKLHDVRKTFVVINLYAKEIYLKIIFTTPWLCCLSAVCYTHALALLLQVFTYVDCKWGVNKYPQRISASVLPRDTISMAIPPFSRTSNLMETLYDQTGSGKSKMVAANAEIVIPQLADVTATKFRWLPPHFRGPDTTDTVQDTMDDV